MTEIDFHVNLADPLDYGYRLLRKVHGASRQALVLCRDADQLDALDRALWEREPGSFLPHVRADDPLAPLTPLVLVRAEDARHADFNCPHHDVLVNFAIDLPPHFSRFTRLVELVPDTEPDRLAARERFRHYRDRGYPLRSHTAKSRP